MSKKLFVFLFLCLFSSVAFAQNLITIQGAVRDENQQPLAKVTVALVGLAGKTQTNEQGEYQLESRLRYFSVSYKLIGYKTQIIKFSAAKGETVVKNISLQPEVKELKTVEISKNDNNLAGAQKINLNSLSNLPMVSMNFESILKTLPGVSTNNELTSQYSVRGGNFDENLIYVNDIEINRPVLIRNGQQEGLSFINPDLVSRANFSAGGFSARYDDKLSSVLDVKYDRPDSNQYIFTAGLMGLSATAKVKLEKAYFLFGFRRKNNKNILATQDQLGSYQPSFNDVQAIYQKDFSSKFSLNLLANLNTGRFQLIPESRETLFGTMDKPMRLNIDYDGKEVDDYYSYGVALSMSFHPSNAFNLKWINSYFDFVERERFDIDGNYVFEEIDTNPANENGFGPIRKNRGLGSYYAYARNKLNTGIASSTLKIQNQLDKHELTYGLKLEHSLFKDGMNEYNYIDSAGYIKPVNHNSFTFQNSIYSNNQLKINNFSAFIQDNINLTNKTDIQLGLRLSKSGLNDDILFSPRLLLVHRPDEYKLWRFTAGIYHQLPSYRSIRDAVGSLYLFQKTQQSYNLSAAYDFSFIGLGTRLKFTSELYYKYGSQMIPYTVDNVRIKYLTHNLAKGNTYGADFSIGGELIKDLMSYFRVSLLSATQQFEALDHLAVIGNIQSVPLANKVYRRPSDQRLNLSLFFQDRLFKSPTYKVHLNLLYGSRLPVGSPFVGTYSDNFSIPAYRRVDIGFSTDFLDPQLPKRPVGLSRYFHSVIAYAEVFNLLNINNTVSYLWLKDVDNVSYAIPNYLTMRQLNFKLVFKFKN